MSTLLVDTGEHIPVVGNVARRCATGGMCPAAGEAGGHGIPFVGPHEMDRESVWGHTEAVGGVMGRGVGMKFMCGAVRRRGCFRLRGRRIYGKIPPVRSGVFNLAALAVCLVGSAWARPAVPVELPSVVHADTETTTNVSFTASLDVAGRFSFDLSCRATPSNNVEVAFGTDANANGVLDPEEVDRVVGWDCGAWFTRKGSDGEYVSAAVESPDEVRTLSWKLQVGASGLPSRLDAKTGGVPVFVGLPLDSVYSPSWNLLKLTGRGLDASLETFSVTVTPDGTVFIMR